MFESVSRPPRRAITAPAPFADRAAPVILAALGTAWVAAGVAVVALVPAGANGIGLAWAAWGVAHLAAALGTHSGTTGAHLLAAALGLVGLLGATVVVAFIVGMNLSEGRGFDPGTTWFSPLNGWATVLVGGTLVVADLALVAGAAQAFRQRARTA
jgi:hypothetical protein